MNKININELTFEELEHYIEELGEKKFHAKQIFKWLHRIKVTSFEEMTDISKSLREKLEEKCYILVMNVIECQKSKKDGTMKFLIALSDGCAIESVLMRYHHGNTICVSTQVGCKMGCKFCASTKEGFEKVRTHRDGISLPGLFHQLGSQAIHDATHSEGGSSHFKLMQT